MCSTVVGQKQRKFGRRVGHEVEGTRKSSCVADYSWQEVEVFVAVAENGKNQLDRKSDK